MISMARRVVLSIALFVVAFAPPASSFTVHSINTKPIGHASTSQLYSSRAQNRRSNNRPDYLLENFKTASGEVLNPYRVLKVSRSADRIEIKKAYRSLSRKYHPDGARFREILPGKCNNLDEVRDEWERIKLSYEILSDPKMRLRYDRNTAIADPGAAVGRAALGAVGWGFSSVGKGLLGVGEMALKQMKKD
mmetsp:Transcript_38930/g.58480  ORF Transcript_38930/g.58480 Transcript_38930/m.58480 type:complete len:192 (-) Transcript_38930:665-1240(-)